LNALIQALFYVSSSLQSKPTEQDVIFVHSAPSHAHPRDYKQFFV
jgi:hypothetical protein